jgi:4-oxalomesaconate tautomerase
MLAGVAPFGIETGLIAAKDGETSVMIFNVNTEARIEAIVQTPGRAVSYAGDARIDGVPGTAAPITINFLDTAGSVCPSLLPSGRVLDEIDVGGAEPCTVRATLIDNGMPMVIVRATDFGITGYESVDDLNGNAPLRARLEALRLACGPLMGLGDVSKKSYPKMCLVAAPAAGGNIATRCFIPHVCHEAIGVLAAVTVGTACVLEGSITQGIAVLPDGLRKTVSVEHPTGEFSVELELDPQDHQKVVRAALLRTARPIMRGEVLIPE